MSADDGMVENELDLGQVDEQPAANETAPEAPRERLSPTEQVNLRLMPAQALLQQIPLFGRNGTVNYELRGEKQITITERPSGQSVDEPGQTVATVSRKTGEVTIANETSVNKFLSPDQPILWQDSLRTPKEGNVAISPAALMTTFDEIHREAQQSETLDRSDIESMNSSPDHPTRAVPDNYLLEYFYANGHAPGAVAVPNTLNTTGKKPVMEIVVFAHRMTNDPVEQRIYVPVENNTQKPLMYNYDEADSAFATEYTYRDRALAAVFTGDWGDRYMDQYGNIFAAEVGGDPLIQLEGIESPNDEPRYPVRQPGYVMTKEDLDNLDALLEMRDQRLEGEAEVEQQAQLQQEETAAQLAEEKARTQALAQKIIEETAAMGLPAKATKPDTLFTALEDPDLRAKVSHNAWVPREVTMVEDEEGNVIPTIEVDQRGREYRVQMEGGTLLIEAQSPENPDTFTLVTSPLERANILYSLTNPREALTSPIGALIVPEPGKKRQNIYASLPNGEQVHLGFDKKDYFIVDDKGESRTLGSSEQDETYIHYINVVRGSHGITSAGGIGLVTSKDRYGSAAQPLNRISENAINYRESNDALWSAHLFEFNQRYSSDVEILRQTVEQNTRRHNAGALPKDYKPLTPRQLFDEYYRAIYRSPGQNAPKRVYVENGHLVADISVLSRTYRVTTDQGHAVVEQVIPEHIETQTQKRGLAGRLLFRGNQITRTTVPEQTVSVTNPAIKPLVSEALRTDLSPQAAKATIRREVELLRNSTTPVPMITKPETYIQLSPNFVPPKNEEWLIVATPTQKEYILAKNSTGWNLLYRRPDLASPGKVSEERVPFRHETSDFDKMLDTCLASDLPILSPEVVTAVIEEAERAEKATHTRIVRLLKLAEPQRGKGMDSERQKQILKTTENLNPPRPAIKKDRFQPNRPSGQGQQGQSGQKGQSGQQGQPGQQGRQQQQQRGKPGRKP